MYYLGGREVGKSASLGNMRRSLISHVIIILLYYIVTVLRIDIIVYIPYKSRASDSNYPTA